MQRPSASGGILLQPKASDAATAMLEEREEPYAYSMARI